jgi:hypothetical protein
MKKIKSVPIMRWRHFRKQIDFTCSVRGDVISDILFPVENMRDGLQVVRKYMARKLNVPDDNASGRDSQSNELPDSVVSYFKEDLQLWNAVYKSDIIHPKIGSYIPTDASNFR